MTDFIHIKMLLLFTSENKDLNCKIKEHKDFTLAPLAPLWRRWDFRAAPLWRRWDFRAAPLWRRWSC